MEEDKAKRKVESTEQFEDEPLPEPQNNYEFILMECLYPDRQFFKRLMQLVQNNLPSSIPPG